MSKERIDLKEKYESKKKEEDTWKDKLENFKENRYKDSKYVK